MLGNCVAMISTLYSLACLMMCFSRNVIGPSFNISSSHCHQSFWKDYGIQCAISCGFMASMCSFSLPSLGSSFAFSFPSMLACARTLYNVLA